MRINANVELDAGSKTFASGFLPELIAALRRSRKGDLVAVTSADPAIGPELEAWCRFTRNSLVDTEVEEGRTRWVLRYGEAPRRCRRGSSDRIAAVALFHFDCNLACDYCCACAPHPKRRGGRWDWRACAGLGPRRPSSASAKSLSPVASRSCCRTLAGWAPRLCGGRADHGAHQTGMPLAGKRREMLRARCRAGASLSRLVSTARRRSVMNAIAARVHGRAPGRK